MQRVYIILIFIIIMQNACFRGEAMSAEKSSSEPATVDFVDLSRYVGLWYEIVKIPNRFQRNCAYGTTAEYSLRDDGKIDVVNRCFDEDGKMDEAKGVAKIVDNVSNAKLKVSFVSIFGWRLFWGDYWIIGLDPEYHWAIVGAPDRKYGWILCRSTHLTENEQQKIFSILREQGYQPEDFEFTEHRE